MEEIHFPTESGALAAQISGRLVGDPDVEISAMMSLEDAVRGEASGFLCYLADKKYSVLVSKLGKGVVLLPENLAGEFAALPTPPSASPTTFIIVENPKAIFSQIAKTLNPPQPWNGISATATIHPSAILEPGVVVGPGTVICEGAKIGRDTVLFPNVYIGPHIEIGSQCELHPGVVILANTKIGNAVKIFSGTVIGSEGFGFAPDSEGGHSAVPQIGRVVIEDNIRIGAKCTIDRATIGETRIGSHTIIDDQVHIGHNSRIGRGCILCAQVGLAGSTILEDNVVLGGQVGLAGHMTVGKGARLGGQTGAGTDLEAGKTYLSSPAMPIDEALRAFRYSRKLPELFKRVKTIEGKINADSSDSNR